MSRFFEYLPKAIDAGESFALAIISRIKGSSPQKAGAKALFFSDGRIHGTLGGGCLEAEVQDRARRALLTGQPSSFELVLDHDFGWDDGLICGGKVSGLIVPHAEKAGALWRQLVAIEAPFSWGVTADYSFAWPLDKNKKWLYRETVFPFCHLWIAGSGHIAQAVAPLAEKVDFVVTVFDDRPLLANRTNFPPPARLRVGPWEKLLDDPFIEAPVFGLIVTRGHQHDALVLRHWIQRKFAFLGMIGSKRKARLIFSQFLEDKLATKEQLAAVACPVGLDIDAISPSEIAVSIISQLIQKRAALIDVKPLDDTRQPLDCHKEALASSSELPLS